MPSSFLLTFQAWYKLMIYTSDWSLFLVFLSKEKLLWGFSGWFLGCSFSNIFFIFFRQGNSLFSFFYDKIRI